MARQQLFTGLIVDSDMPHGYVRIMGSRTTTWVMTRETYWRISERDGFGVLTSMAEVLGPGMHPLPPDWQ